MLLQVYVALLHEASITKCFLQTSIYLERTRARDPCCIISGLLVVRGNFSRFKATHIFPRTHKRHNVDVRPSCSFHSLTVSILWVNKDYSKSYHGSCDSFRTQWTYQNRLDSNVILLRSDDLHDAWVNYKLAVNPGVCVSHLRPLSVFIIRSDSAGM